MTWPGIPEGRGNTCAEEGCGNARRPKGNDCRKCYKDKWAKHARSTGKLTDGAGGYEVAITRSTRREMDAKSYQEWQSRRDEHS